MGTIEFILLMCLFPFSIVIVGFIWTKILKKRHRKRVLIYQTKVATYFLPSERPFSEWRYPVMFLAVSGLVFILIVTMFGVQINTITGETTFEMDWSKYIDEDGLYDPWVYSPFDAWVNGHQELVLTLFICGYYAGVLVVLHGWFEYCRWKLRFLEKIKEKSTI